MLKKFYEWAAKIREKLNEKGQGMVEYALILAAVAIIAVVAIWGTSGTGTGDGEAGGLKNAVTSAFSNATTQINKANTNTKNAGT